MAQLWHGPLYSLTAPDGKTITIDVTTSVSASLPPNAVLLEEVIPLFKSKRIQTVLDFGTGALRHTVPLLQEGFEVCAVEFEEAFARPVCAEAKALARDYSNFSALLWPRDFLKDKRRFQAALLCYVLQTMPLPKERRRALREIFGKLRLNSYLLYMSRYGQLRGLTSRQMVSDGYFMWPQREHHSFYREFTTEQTHEFMEDVGFKRIRSLSRRGTDQIFLYAKGGSTWP